MHSFLFNTVSDVLSGPGTSGQLGEMAAAMGIERLFVVTDPGLFNLVFCNRQSRALRQIILPCISTPILLPTRLNLLL